MHRNIAPETKPCEIICTIAAFARRCCVEDEEAERDETHVRDRRIGDQLLHVGLHQRHQADVDHGDQRQRDDEAGARKWLASGAIGSEKRRKP